MHLAIDTCMTARFLAHRAISVFPSRGDSQSCGRSFFVTYHEPYEAKLGKIFFFGRAKKAVGAVTQEGLPGFSLEFWVPSRLCSWEGGSLAHHAP